MSEHWLSGDGAAHSRALAPLRRAPETSPQAWFAQLSADGWILLEPYVFDKRRHKPGDVAATGGTFRPTRTS